MRRLAGGLSAVDVFCGAGGMSWGLAASGFHIAAHFDHWPPAVSTLNANFASSSSPVNVVSLTAKDIRLAVGGTPVLLAGGPPCQSFTSAGRREDDDPRGTLVGVYARLAAELRAPLVVFENVEGLLTAGKGRYLLELLDPLLDAGYLVAIRKVNLANYGVPQHRKRVIGVASLLGPPPFPEPSHGAWGAPGAVWHQGMPPTQTVSEALRGLPPPGVTGPQGHTATRLGETEMARIAALQQGQTMRDLPESLWHASYRDRASRRVSDGTPSARRGGPPAGIRRLCEDQPSKAITASAVRDLIHPSEQRPLTLRELARLQTFPDSFVFHGTASDQATQIGNAVPPRFGEALGQALYRHLATSGVRTRSRRRGALVELAVANSQTASPAMSKVLDRVRARYGLREADSSPAEPTGQPTA